jgi:hypothetical protein
MADPSGDSLEGGSTVVDRTLLPYKNVWTKPFNPSPAAYQYQYITISFQLSHNPQYFVLASRYHLLRQKGIQKLG